MRKAILVIFALLALLFVGLIFLIKNPERFEAQITQAIEKNTGHFVDIRGEMSWRYWPPIAFQATDTWISSSRTNEPFAHIGDMQIDIDLLPLLRQQEALTVNEIQLADASIELIIDRQGTANWEVTAPVVDETPGNDTESSAPLKPTIDHLLLKNIDVSFIDQRTDDSYRLRINHIATTALTTETPFAVDWSATVSDEASELTASTTGTGEFQLPGRNGQVIFKDIQLTTAIVYQDKPPMEMLADLSGSWHPGREVLTFQRAELRTDWLALTLPLIINLAPDNPEISGKLTAKGDDLRRALARFDIDAPIQHIDLSAMLLGRLDAFRLTDVTGQIDASTVKGTLNITLEPQPAISTDLRIDTISTDYYLNDGQEPSDTSTESPVATATTSNDVELIPLDLLSSFDTKSIVRIKQLSHADIQFDDVKVEITNQDAVLDLLVSAKGLGGNIVASLDTTVANPGNSHLRVSLDGLDVAQLFPAEGLTGQLKGHLNVTFKGHMLGELSESISGNTVFTVADGTLDVTPIKRMAMTIDTLRGKRSRISDWPDTMPFEHMVGEHVLEQGLASGQFFEFELENLSVTGHGGIDLVNETLHYNVTAILDQTDQGAFKVSDQLAGIRWPMTCQGSFTAAPADLCFGEEGAIAHLLGDVIKQDLQRRGEDKLDDLINDKVPDELKDLTRKLFRGLRR